MDHHKPICISVLEFQGPVLNPGEEGWGGFLSRAVLCLIAQSCLTLCGHMDFNPPGSSVHGILQATILG